MMSLDAPLFSLLTVDKNDDLARLGVWAKGQMGNLIIWFPKSPTDYGVWHKKEKQISLSIIQG
jgi:hypothetical protein